MSIEGITLKHFITKYQETYSLTFHSRICNYVFHSSLSDHSKQDAVTTSAHIKQTLEMLKKRIFMVSGISTIWDNTYGCAEHYRCATALYLLSMLLQYFNIIINFGISAQGYVREVVDNFYAKQKFIFHLMATVQLPGSEQFDTKNNCAHSNTEY